MKTNITFLLRIALGIGFLSAVADRFGYWGKPGDPAVAWGNWENFVNYTATLNFGFIRPYANILGLVATAAELLFGILLVAGFKTKYVAALSGALLFIFALMMSVNTHVKSAFDYSVFTASFAAFLLAFEPVNKWSMDGFLEKT